MRRKGTMWPGAREQDKTAEQTQANQFVDVWQSESDSLRKLGGHFL